MSSNNHSPQNIQQPIEKKRWSSIIDLVALVGCLLIAYKLHVYILMLAGCALLVLFAFSTITGWGLKRFRHRGKAVLSFALTFIVMGYGAVTFDKERELRWAALRTTDAEAYLSELQVVDADRWLDELRVLRPDEHAAELEKRREEDAARILEQERLAAVEQEQQRAEQAAVEQREREAAAAREKLIAQSDDLERNREIFAKATAALISTRNCTEQHFIDHGGWVRSTSFPDRSVYFVYCGRPNVNSRIYLDTATGEVFSSGRDLTEVTHEM